MMKLLTVFMKVFHNKMFQKEAEKKNESYLKGFNLLSMLVHNFLNVREGPTAVRIFILTVILYHPNIEFLEHSLMLFSTYKMSGIIMSDQTNYCIEKCVITINTNFSPPPLVCNI